LEVKIIPSPKVTIITASYQACDALRTTIESVAKQSYQHLEHIIIDGGSTDGTRALLAEHHTRVTYWCSEPDKGISDAFNKGIQKSTGTYINFQGAGDIFCHPDAIAQMMQSVDSSVYPLVCGRVVRLTDSGAIQWIAPRKFTKHFRKSQLLFKMALPHQALFTRRDFFEKYGLFDSSCPFAMDYEHLLRAYHQFPTVCLKNVCVSNWQGGGVGFGRTLDVYQEYDRIKRFHQVASPRMLTAIHYWNVLKYYIKKNVLRREA